MGWGAQLLEARFRYHVYLGISVWAFLKTHFKDAYMFFFLYPWVSELAYAHLD